MPSRKKAQGKARKEKKQSVEQSYTPHVDSSSQACLHLSQQRKDWSRDDLDAAKKLADEYLSKYGRGGSKQDFDRVHNEFYVEYRQLSHDGKELFKEMMVASGTAAVIYKAKQTDLSKVSRVPNANHFIYAMLTIEVRDRYSGAFDVRISNEIHMSMDDIVRCPREIVRFFHRRNFCTGTA